MYLTPTPRFLGCGCDHVEIMEENYFGWNYGKWPFESRLINWPLFLLFMPFWLALAYCTFAEGCLVLIFIVFAEILKTMLSACLRRCNIPRAYAPNVENHAVLVNEQPPVAVQAACVVVTVEPCGEESLASAMRRM
jgi:hypothetical protein